MKVVAWLSAFLIYLSLYTAYRLEHLVNTQQTARAPEMLHHLKQTAQQSVFESVQRLMNL